MRAPLDRLLRPRSIAVVGGREAEKVARECRRIGFDGPIYPVNHRRETIAGIPCRARLEDLPEPPDAAFIAIPADPAVEAVGILASMGAGGAVVYASGFSEIGGVGAERQARLVAASGDMALLGPNCYGSVSYLEGVALWPDDHGGRRVERGVAIVTQSGNVGISLSMQERGVPIAHLAALGNQAKDGVPQIVESLLRDDRITAIGLFIESVGDIPAFRRAADAAARKRVPLVALKTGRSEASAKIALSHTSSMTGSAAAFDALCRRHAIVQAENLPQFMEFLKFLHVFPGLDGNRLLTMSCSGGEAGVLADIAARRGMPMPAFDADRRLALFDVLGDKVTIDNPLDYHTYIWGDGETMRTCFTEALRHDVDVGLLALDTPDRPELDLFGWPEAIDAVIAAARETRRPTIVASSLPESMSPTVRDRFLAAGIAPMQGFDDALAAVDQAAWYGSARARAGTLAIPDTPATPLGDPVVLDEWRAKRALAIHGLRVPEGTLVSSSTEAVAAAESLGFPVVLKACGADLAHKTEVGGVALNLPDADAVFAAAERMVALSDRLIVEKMMRGAVCEMILGVTHEPGLGPVVVLGAGGVLAELVQDTVVLPLPLADADVEEALDGLRVSTLLRGYRGGPPGDRAAVVGAVKAVAAFAETHADRLLELDVNPLIVLREGEGAVAADALIRWTEPEEVAHP
jgi:acyl-CoA synthetase (NDP forming)